MCALSSGLAHRLHQLSGRVEVPEMRQPEPPGAGRPRPPAHGEDLLRRFRTGITLAQDSMADETFRVVSVAPASPGSQAGVTRGDVLLELDGRPSKEFTLEEVKQAIRLDGKRLLTVERGGKRVKVIIELGGREMPLPPPAGGAGARVARRPS
ncbi:MAG TPA: PDZ domain-containing protein [Vicinamibacteria bacterium]|nr:PDZ domain-containing protein [Vicinamibacteria bacterium]